MAGIEQLEVHSKSYIVRWVRVAERHTISWSVQPHKKSINFGIVKHPGSGATSLTTHPDDSATSLEQLNSSTNNVKTGSRFSKNDASTAQEQLSNKGFIHVKWLGKCEADKVSMGTHDVPPGQGGMYGLVFDNTFSKQTGKTATLVLLTYPTGVAPQGAHNLPNLQAGPHASASKTSLGKSSSHKAPGPGESTESLGNHATGKEGHTTGKLPRSDSGNTFPLLCHTGNLLKRGRKKRQGYARRFFSLDYTTCTLSYYYNRKSSALRGAIPLSLAAIAADERRREISIDSGAEIWHLKASNATDFKEWARALEKASRVARGLEAQPQTHSVETLSVTAPGISSPNTQFEDDREWQQVEALVSRVVGTRDALRRLVKDLATQRQFQRPVSSHLSPASPSTPGTAEESESYFAQPAPEKAPEKRPFWKRKASSTPLTAASLAPAVTSSLAVPAPGSISGAKSNGGHIQNMGQEEKGPQEHCAALLNDLDLVVSEFTNVLTNRKRRRAPLSRVVTARRSMESSTTADEFFDAEAGEAASVDGMMIIDRIQSGGDSADEDEASIHDDSSISSVEDDEEQKTTSGTAALYPAKPKSLAPLPIDIAVERRQAIPRNTIPPPSLISLVRKNVGKDLSGISMPVSTNEPLSLLQRTAEQLEYAQLLDKAATLPSVKDRLIHMAAFAISQISVNRAKERAVRKPFNPLLGETFELLRTDSEVPGGFRLLVEKVCHRPVRLALHADAAGWSLTQTATPLQKFWGKSAELTTEGRVRVSLRLPDGTDELYSWNIGTMFLRNMVMGEKYVEPAGTMTVFNDSTGAKANIEFKTKGMFGGRCEDVQVEAYGADGSHLGAGLMGTWTQALRAVENGKMLKQDLWHVGSLASSADEAYGLTAFAASLNEITAIEKDRIPHTDTRLRPDQRLLEKVDIDEAERVKTQLEEAQRRRRAQMEERGEAHRPKWFVKVGETPDGEELWKMKTGKDGYWEERIKGEWKGVEEIFTTS